LAKGEIMPTDKRDKTIEFEAPSVAQWREDSEISNAGTKGWNPLSHLQGLLHRNIPGLRPFKVGHCSEADLPTWRTIGWVHMRRDHFKIENFNEAIGLGLGLSDETGVIMYNDNYIMIMPLDYRKRVIDHRNASFEEMYERTGKKHKGQVGASPADANASELQEIADAASGLEEESFTVSKN